MQTAISFFTNPNNWDLLATLGILAASELHGWGKGGSLFQTSIGLLARWCTKFSTPAHQQIVAEVLKAQGVADVGTAPATATQTPSA